MKTVAIIPAYNEEGTIKEVVSGLKDRVDRIIIVNDGSTDRTGEIIKTLGITAVTHDKNKGYGMSMKSGFKKGLEAGGDIFLLIDADLQHNPAEATNLIDFLKSSKADMVIGSRYLKNKSHIPLYRNLGIRLFTIMTRVLIGVKTTDSQSGFRVFTRKALEKVADFKTANMGASLEILYLAKKNNLEIKEHPITCAYENIDYSVNPVKHGLQLIKILFKLYLKIDR